MGVYCQVLSLTADTSEVAGTRDLSFQARVSEIWAQAGEVFYGVDKVIVPTLWVKIRN